ncbi:MAG: MFS transporter [Phenylobacterium sp.]|uniref:MFS transporter n=1 Tax=Phenylobacterium sp. TaxID=1871053 RepID=UPI00273301CB|nr:MFS transporter [Phenylobacterium sp.]MDP3749388.1 MFS transporter [Phenylobacterium sp.]
MPIEARTGAEAAPKTGFWFKWEIVALLWFAFFLNQADRQIFGVTLPLIRAEFDLSDQQMGLVATTFSIVFGLLVPIAGLAGDIFKRRDIVVFSLILFSVGTLLTGFSANYLLLLLFRGLATGAGEAFYAPAANSLIAERHIETRARALSIHQTANYTGVVLGSLFAGWVADQHGWRAAFMTFGVAGLVWAGVILLRAQSQPPPAARPTGSLADHRRLALEALGVLVRSPLLLGQTVGFCGLVFMLVGYLTWMPTILYERFQLSLASAGFSSVVYHHVLGYAGLLATGVVTDRLVRRFTRIRVLSMAGALMLCAPFIWLSANAADLWVVYAALGAFGLFRGVYDANLYAAMFDAVEDRLRSSVAGLIIACAYVVGAFAPWLMGVLKGAYGVRSGLEMLAAVALATGALFLAFVLSTRPKPRSGL